MRRLVCCALLMPLLPVFAGQTKGARPHLKPLSPAFFGAWKENPAKGREPDITVTFIRKADGIHLGDAAQAFQYDGVDRPSGPGITTAWRKTAARSYRMVTMRRGNLTSTTTRTISADGNAMTVIVFTTESSTRTTTETTEWKRVGVAADPDLLVGTWKSDPPARPARSPGRMIIEKAGDAIRLSHGLSANPEFVARLDGPNYAWQGKKGPGAISVSLTQLDDHAFVEFLNLKGSPFLIHEFVLSEDGKTITKTTTIVRQSPSTSVSVYEKQ